MRYEIEKETHAVKIFEDNSDVPSIFQPDWPDLTPWANAKEAEKWAKLYIKSIEDESAPFAPSGPKKDGEPKPTPEQIEAMKAEMEKRKNG
jgi:hypothetical protein